MKKKFSVLIAFIIASAIIMFAAGCSGGTRDYTPSELAAMNSANPTPTNTIAPTNSPTMPAPETQPTVEPSATPTDKPTSYIKGTVLDNTANPLEGVRVSAVLNGEIVSFVYTNSVGQYSLPVAAGIYDIKFEKRPYNQVTENSFNVPLTSELVLNKSMIPGANFWGFVFYGTTGTGGVKNVTVTIKEGSTTIQTLQTESDGFYGISIPEPSENKTYTVEYAYSLPNSGGYFLINNLQATSQTALIPSGNNNLTQLARVSYIAPDFKISGKLTNSSAWAHTQNPLPGMFVSHFYITVAGDSENPISFPCLLQNTQKDGSFWFTVPQNELPQAGKYTIWAGNPSNNPEPIPGHMDIEITPGIDIANVNLTLIKPTGIMGLIYDGLTTTPLSGIRVQVYDPANNPVMYKVSPQYDNSISPTTSNTSNPVNPDTLLNINYRFKSFNLLPNINYRVVAFDPNRDYAPTTVTVNLKELFINENTYAPMMSMQKRQNKETMVLTISGLALYKPDPNFSSISLEEGTVIRLYKVDDNGKKSDLIATTKTNAGLQTNFSFEIINPANDHYFDYTDLKSNQQVRFKQKFIITVDKDDIPGATPPVVVPTTTVETTIDYTEHCNVGRIELAYPK